MKAPRFKVGAPKEWLLGFFLAAILTAPVWGSEASTKSAVPGTLNYVEGHASMGDQALNSKSIGSAELQPGQSLTTEKGKAEVLLTPGVFLRIGNNSSIKLISPSLTDTEVEVDQGHAMVEVAELHPENSIRIDEDGTTTQLLKTGLYDFNRNQRELRVFDGKATVESGREHVNVKGGRELTLANNELSKARKFDKKSYEEGDLFRWSSLRSGYLAEANVDAAGMYAANGWGGPGWWGADWYWDPWFDAFTFIPGDGIFYSPFGWGFYSPWGYIRLRSSAMVATGTVAIDTSTITSAKTPITGAPVLTMWEDAVTLTASIEERDLQETVSIPDHRWVAPREASEDLVAADSTAAVVGFMEVAADSTAAVVVFMEVVAGSTAVEVVAGSMVGDPVTIKDLSG
jgi:FecR protein